ncbi:MAG: radical SAM protein [Candidatus Schekmanbacteria bacterium]|nr:MAG: radical SAM protein [Candidatus Schekmanbacteria bacterium]
MNYPFFNLFGGKINLINSWIASYGEKKTFMLMKYIMILLINPPYFNRDELKERFSSFMGWIKRGNMYAVAFEPPLGISELATFLNSNGIETSVLDIPGLFMTDEEVEDEISRLTPEIVGITAMSATIFESLKIAEIVKKVSPSSIVVLGGVHPTVMPASVLKNDVVDFVVRGEGEYALYEIYNAIKNKKDLTYLKELNQGICFNDNSSPIISERAELIENLDKIPLADYSLFPAENYIKYNQDLRGIRGISMIAGRGCPYSCTFCAVNKTMGRRDRRRKPEIIISKIKELADSLNIEGIWFKDSTFNINRKWVEKFCSLIKRELPGFKWQINTRVDLVNEEEIEMMKDAGLVQIDLGIESGSSSTLALLGKKYSVDEIYRSVSIAKRYVKVAGFFMIGLPGETEKDIDATFELAKLLELDSYSFSIFSPLPGTKLFERLVEEGKISEDKWNYKESHFTKTKEVFCSIDRDGLLRKYSEINNFFSSH